MSAAIETLHSIEYAERCDRNGCDNRVLVPALPRSLLNIWLRRNFFPRLPIFTPRIIAPADSLRNCHAYCLGLPDWFDVEKPTFPAGLPVARHLSVWESALDLIGFNKGTAGHHVIAMCHDGGGYVWHSCVKVGNRWNSKMGESRLLEHRRVEDVLGGIYGDRFTLFSK